MTRDLMALRQYQREAVDAVHAAHKDGTQHPAVVIGTGGGKTVIFANLIAEHIERTGTRAVVLVHRDELADQTVDKLRAVAPHLSVGKVKAADDDTLADVMVCSVQTLSRANRINRIVSDQKKAGKIGLMITDEVHHATAPSYTTVYNALPEVLKAGFTATLARGDGTGLGSVIDDVVYTKSLAWMISKGYLVPPHGRSVDIKGLDLKGVRRTAGDYQAGALGDALLGAGAPEQIAAAVHQYAADRRTVVFCPDVASAQATAAALGNCAVITGTTPCDERHAMYEAFRLGRISALVSVMVLSEGWDAPWADCAVIARPTQSQPLYQQLVGRVLRPFPGKTDALILDMVGASANKLITLIDLEPGLFPKAKPCTTCRRLPCVCPCEGCGGPRPCQTCREEQPELVLSGTGKAVELFAASRSAWLSTYGGVMFIPAGDSSIVLWPDKEGTWAVTEAPRKGAGVWLHRGLPMEAAMGWAETEAEDRGEFIALRGASWRKRKAPATEAQLRMAVGIGITVPDGTSKSELSDMISVHMASRRLDKKKG